MNEENTQPRDGDSGLHHVQVRGVTKKFGEFTAIDNLDLSVEKGKFYALLGPSGCGKSTLLRMIAGLEEVSWGTIQINARDVTHIPAAQRKIAMVFQTYALYPHMTVRQNIGFSLAIAGASKGEQRQRTDDVAHMLQLSSLLDRRPANLSGGQRQRVAIGRALVRNPEVFLFDEPLSNLDAVLRVQMRLELAKLHKELGATMIYVTHDQVEAMTLADRIVVLYQGTVQQVGAPLELYNAPQNKFVASFIGSPTMNFLRVKPERIDFPATTIRFENGTSVQVAILNQGVNIEGGQFELGVRPEHIRLIEPNNPGANFVGTVVFVERLGNTTYVYLETPYGNATVEIASDMAIDVGQRLGLALNEGKLHLFGDDGRKA